MFKRFIKEPLVHFLLVGVSLFVLFNLVAPPQQDDLEITVSTGQQQALRARFENTWQRPPKKTEMQALIEDYVLNEVYYREAKAIGMDENDSNIRQRLRQKMAFLLAEASAQVAPSAQELMDYYKQNLALFQEPESYSFEQILIAKNKTTQQIALMHKLLLEGEKPIGAASILAPAYFDNDTQQIAQLFGQKFAKSLSNLPTDTWSQPVHSALGQHFIRITQYQAQTTPPLESIKAQVTQRWLDDNKQKRTEQVNQQLLAKYQIKVAATDG